LTLKAERRSEEVGIKLATARVALAAADLGAIRLRGVDWFSWATAGGSSTVILTAETGIAEVLITASSAFVLTTAIEVERLAKEELPPGFELISVPWADTEAIDAFVRNATGGRIASDRPRGSEVPLPASIARARLRLEDSEIERYRALGREASEAMTEVLSQAMPDWSENRLAGEGARALWARGIHPTLCLVGGESRVDVHRHPFPTAAPLGRKAMLVFCARRAGLYANLTRWVYFKDPTPAELKLRDELARIEAEVLAESLPGRTLSQIYETFARAYRAHGHADEILKHHQGGPTGYLSREEIARPGVTSPILDRMALAWNPSLTGAKIEDTVLVREGRAIEVLTADPAWPTFSCAGRKRPDYQVRS
jgi:Xaa-Pro aminopeptidase